MDLEDILDTENFYKEVDADMGNDDGVAEVYMSDGEDNDANVDPGAMVDALRLAGVDAAAAAQSANAMCGIRSKADKSPTLLEV